MKDVAVESKDRINSLNIKSREKISAPQPKAKEKKGYIIVKRSFDIAVSLVLGIILLIPMLIIGVVIRLNSPGPAIFKQERMGKNGKIFTMLKFRSMRVDAPAEMPTNDFHDSDAYITKFGRFLRKSSLDELPQLWNVLIGDMSFVGYRPVCLAEKELNDLRREYGVLSIRPGLTGYAQVNGRDNIDYIEKAKLDAQYVESMSVKMDLWCLWKTIATVISHEGAK